MSAPTTTPSTPRPTPLPASAPSVPPLENGDHLTRDEFERRYEAMPHIKKAELIEGVVYLQHRVPATTHGIPHADLVGVIGTYRAYTPAVKASDGPTVFLDMDNVPQPDIVVLLDPAIGGKCRITNGFINGSPELICEVSTTQASIDLGKKFHVYRRNGVREYVVWRVLDRAINWFILRGSDFERLAPGTDGVYRSEVFPGLWLDAGALLAGDLPRVHQVLHQGLNSPEHRTFVEKLIQSIAGNVS